MPEHVFDGLKVVDAASVIAAPAAAMMLADFGADVIKIERPGRGDMLRSLSPVQPPHERGNGWFWQMDARNKRSLTLDLKTERGMEVMRRLVATCDVFITNQPYDSREAMRLTYEDLQPLNPRMIYASLTAYGEHGAERNRKSFDQLAYWARSGLMDLMRERGTRPTQGLPGMGDHPTGVALYAGIVTALLQREQTGEGGMVHTSLLANGLWSVSGIAGAVVAGGDMENYRTSHVQSAMMRVYEASDGRWLQLNMVRNEELLARLFTAMDAAHILADERFATPRDMWQNRDALGDAIAEIIATRTSEEWLEAFGSLDVPVNRVSVVEETATDEQVLANAMSVRPEDDETELPWVLTHPVKGTSVPPVAAMRAPRLGEHSREILAELGYDAEAIRAMADAGVI
ncbi:MAG: CoA transferase [Gammaproteobacteria bacterium]|nr:CoA transferase [Gammaproteobacteria bacterium]